MDIYIVSIRVNLSIILIKASDRFGERHYKTKIILYTIYCVYALHKQIYNDVNKTIFIILYQY
jgi:hypothetical protein